MQEFIDQNTPDAVPFLAPDTFDPSAPGHLAKGRAYVPVERITPQLATGERYAATWSRTDAPGLVTYTRDVEPPTWDTFRAIRQQLFLHWQPLGAMAALSYGPYLANTAEILAGYNDLLTAPDTPDPDPGIEQTRIDDAIARIYTYDARLVELLSYPPCFP